MLSLDNAYSEDELREFQPGICRALGRAADDAAGLRRRAQDRRPQHRADLRARPAGARRHARRRHPRRKRHLERPRHPGDSAGAAAATAPERDGDPRRGLPAARGVSEDERRARAGRACRCSPTRAMPRPGAMRTLDARAVAKRGLRAYTYQIVAARRRPSRRCRLTADALRQLADVGLSGRAALAAL